MCSYPIPGAHEMCINPRQETFGAALLLMKYESRAIIKNVAQQGECKRHVNCDDVAVNAVSSQQPFPCLALPGLAFARSCLCPVLPFPTLPHSFRILQLKLFDTFCPQTQMNSSVRLRSLSRL